MKPRLVLILILLGTLGLRVGLALQGGQFFFGDEGRQQRGTDLFWAIWQSDWEGARLGLAQPEHAAFTWLGALLAGPLQLLARAIDYTGPPGSLTAAALSCCSTLIVWLVHQLARLSGAAETEALWATGFAATSNTLFYYARHLLPYDAALACWLGALCLSHHPRSRVLLASGLLASLTCHLYNGYWFLPPLAAAWTLSLSENRSTRRVALWSAGALIGLVWPVLTGWVAGGTAYWQTLRAFAGTVKQGLFAEGWTLPWAYLWHSEQWLGAGVLLCLGGALVRAPDVPARAIRPLLLAGALIILLGMVSAGLEIFVIYARTVRPLVPLFCLAGGWAIGHGLRNRPRLVVPGVVLLAGLAVHNLAPHFGMTFPTQFEALVQRELGATKRWVSFRGTLCPPFGRAAGAVRADLALADAQFLYPLREFRGYPAGRVLLESSHPLSYPPFQYEGHTPRERRMLRQSPFSMRLILLATPSAVPLLPLPQDLFSLEDRPDGYDRLGAPR